MPQAPAKHPTRSIPRTAHAQIAMMDYIMGNNAGALWDQMSSERE